MKRGKVVLTSGAFDILHPGHIYLLRYARRIAGERGRVVVVVARDETVKRRKGRSPVLDEEARLQLVRSLKYVDEAILGFRPFSFKRVIDRFKPDVVLFGYDQSSVMRNFVEEAERRGWKVKVVKAPRLNRKGASSSELIERAFKLLASNKKRS